MGLEFVKAGTADALTLNGISKRAFDSDVKVGAVSPCGPPGYMSVPFHTKMARTNCLYKLTLDTPVWNIRTNAFYEKLGYKKIKQDDEFVYYSKQR